MPDEQTAAQNAELERERLISLINSMADGVLAIDEAGKIVASNGAALNILDLNGNLTGQPITAVLKLIDKQNQPVDIAQVIRETKTPMTSRDWRLPYSQDDIIHVYVSISPVHLGFGRTGPRGHVILLRDITREKSLEEERDEFISVVSHELRTPIAIAEGNIGNARYLVEKAGGQNQVVADALKEAHDQINFLAGMINDLATLSRAERGKLAVEATSINVHNLLSSLAETYAKQAADKGLELRTQLDPQLELLHSSELYVREILQNFVTNAIKYTEQGQITLGAQARPDGVLFYVTDTGVGISHTDQAKVFDKFFRADNSSTRVASGTGLGLYVTQKLAKLLHAQLGLQSELGQGSTFSVRIPNLG